jgi:hypothetical protein
MSHKSKGDQGEYEFTRAASDELRDAEAKYEVTFTVEFRPTPQRGVWYLCVAARAKGEYEALAFVSKYSNTWPNAVATSYAAFLYQCCHRTCRMVEAWHKQRELDEAAPTARG